tara:strand:+ start:1062 stop:1196 length:135 start_codon:yes stop_codon:yes gene_type:complete
MGKEFDEQLSALLTKHFGEDWEYNWEGQDGGFSLQLEVFNQPEK